MTAPTRIDLISILVKAVSDLDAALTGKPADAARNAAQQRGRFGDPQALMSDAYYLADGGFSRLVFLEEGEIRLSGVSRPEVVARWHEPEIQSLRTTTETAWRWLIATLGEV